MRKLSDHGSAAAIGVVVGGLVSIIVGVLVWYKLNTALWAAGSSGHGGTGTTFAAFNTTWAGVNSTANTIWTLFPIISIVMIAGVILAIVMSFGRSSV